MSAVPLLHDYLLDSASRSPDKIALVAGAERWTYGRLAQDTGALAAALIARGVQRGDRVLIVLDNGTEAVIAFWAALRANAVPVLASPQVKAEKLAYLLADSGATALVSDSRQSGVLAAAVARAPDLRVTVLTGRGTDVLPDAKGVVTWSAALADGRALPLPARRCIDVDLASLVYTSGSTGVAKGVMLTHRNMLTAATSISTYLGLRDDDVVLCALPLSFDYGLYQLIMAARLGARVVLERGFTFPGQVVETLMRERVTVFPGVPTMFAMLAEMKSLGPATFASVRVVTNTAAALSRKQIDWLRGTFTQARVYSMYGLTECKRCTYLPPEDLDVKPLSVGVAIPNTELWLVDEDDRRVGPGQVGQLVVRGATVMKGYWRKPEETMRKLRPGPLPGELVLYTGDYCRMDRDGYLYFVSRMDDVIKCRGEKVAPREVETSLVDVPGVKEAAVIGVPDEVLGQAVKAFVVLEAGAHLTVRDLQAECRRRLEGFMIPKEIVLVAELPRTSTGKIKKTDLH